MARPRLGAVFTFVLIAGLIVPCRAQQSEETGSVFAISILSPTAPRDVQVRYLMTGDSGGDRSSGTTSLEGNKLIVSTGRDAASVTTFKAIVFAPGCQLVTISATDLSTAGRQAEFHCQKLPTVPFRGRVVGMVPKDLQVEALYGISWAPQFFELSSISISPFTLGKAAVEPDGSFTMDLPDFAADPLWSSLSSDATLTFYLVDGQSGGRIAKLSSPDESEDGSFKVAPIYPGETLFEIVTQSAAKSQ